MDTPVRIIYGTHTGNSQLLAHEAADKLNGLGLPVSVCDMEDFNTDELCRIKTLLVIVSTDGDGEVPIMAEDLFEFLHKKTDLNLNSLFYSVLALGDTTYTFFCKAGKEFDLLLENLGAKRMAKRIDCDVDYEDGFELWINNVLSALMKKQNNAEN
jgi:sulfite reductase (NADPH) flavoprotein alpha-component